MRYSNTNLQLTVCNITVVFQSYHKVWGHHCWSLTSTSPFKIAPDLSHVTVYITRLHPQGRVARRAYVLDRKYRFSIRELPDFGSRIKKSKKHYFFGTFFDHQIQVFYSWSGQILDPKLVPGTCPKIDICEGILTKTGEMSFYLKQLRDILTTNEQQQHLTNIQNLRLLHNRPFGQKTPTLWSLFQPGGTRPYVEFFLLPRVVSKRCTTRMTRGARPAEGDCFSFAFSDLAPFVLS